MKRSNWLRIAIATVGIMAISLPVEAQIIPDDTLGSERSQVSTRFQINVIEGGAARGVNLFHSFQEFNVEAGGSAYFVRPSDGIQNILARVTGSNRSEILGRLGILQFIDGNRFGASANLFLINPNGIVFGQNTSLDVRGSFTATTASAVQFGSERFSATNPQPVSDVLNVNPSAFLFNQIPGDITVRANAPGFFGGSGSELRVPIGQNLTLLGGNVNIEGGRLNAPGGRVEIGAFRPAGTSEETKVNLNANGSLSNPEGIERADVSLTRDAAIDVRSSSRGDIGITAQNINVSQGSSIDAGISSAIDPGGQAGNIVLNATGVIDVVGRGSYIGNSVRQGSSNAGDLIIRTSRLKIRDGAFIVNLTSSRDGGRGGNLAVTASESVEVVGTTADGQSGSGLATETLGTGRSGDLQITTPFLSVRDGGLVFARTSGSADGGNLMIDKANVIEVEGSSLGNATVISSRTSGDGDAGKIDIKTNYLFLRGGGTIGATAAQGSSGNAGNIEIRAGEAIGLSGFSEGGASGISSAVGEGASGNAGNVSIYTKRLTVRDDAVILSSNLGTGQAGNLSITAKEFVELFGGAGGNLNVASGLDATGQGGNLIIETPRLSIRDGSLVLSSTLGRANAGNVTVIAPELVEISGVSPDGLPSQINAASGLPIDEFSGQDFEFTGQGGNIDIRTGSLTLQEGGAIVSSASGVGNSGSITIDVGRLLMVEDGAISTASLQSSGGDISISAKSIRLVRDSAIATNVSSATGRGGNILLTADTIIALNNSDILSFSRDGIGGNIAFNTRAFLSSPLYRLSPRTTNPAALATLRTNDRVDVNASGTISGSILGVPDIAFLQNGLAQLSQSAIDTNALLANSCIVRNEQNGTFFITGTGGLPTNPGDLSTFSTGTVQPVHSTWKQGDVIVEPQGVYQLPNGALVLSREC
ncbi:MULTISPECIES: filamentous hemagglutinin N-terminal domain-containing protein [Leptolyngbya]|uniref:two-partner secretion domain-containing protein n=1 Tax=Leptolyngbya TaxID=47251 RepID=UPI001683671E|nr:filamentous hemagglutinin N-terminal domain-containing protein [Leptolyngbya sp. FACHB-1624]MBD1855496.1 filamentous hemagglutinin N-terminal domain-containing protein [Leptolyngbya sp. FACHB-1624]